MPYILTSCFAYLIEMIAVAIMYLNIFNAKKNVPTVLAVGILIFTVPTALFLTVDNLYLNCIVFFVANFVFGYLMFDCSKVSALILSVILDALMLGTEFLAMNVLTVVMNTELKDYKITDFMFFLFIFISKMLYFLACQLLSHFKLLFNKKTNTKTPVWLIIYPLCTMFVYVLLWNISFNYQFSNSIKVKGFEGIEDGAVLFNVKFEVIKEDFFVDGYLRDDIFDSFYIVDSGNISDFTFCDWKIQKSDGTEKDISKNMEPSLYATFEGVYEDLLIKNYEPFIPPVDCDITEVTYIQQEDTHKDFTVTANGRKSMIQFMEPDGGTRTYDRYHKNVKITSYNSNGEVVNSMARDLAYEVWEIYSNMSVGNEIKVRGKVNGKWDAEKYSFTIEPYNPIISMELSSTSGKKGPVPATVVADAKTEKVMFKMPDNTTVTVASTATDENGNKIFTGKAWMNKDGLNEIRVFIYRNNV